MKRWLYGLPVAAAYALAGWAALWLALPPVQAAPLYPAAGLALAAVLVLGVPALPGVWLGSTVVNLGLALYRAEPLAQATALAAVLGLGAMLQAAAGAWLARRWCGPELRLDSPRDIARFFIGGGLLACTISACVAVAALSAAGSLPAHARWATGLTWWVGDTLGVLIGAPIALTVLGRPRADWAPRRLTVGLPLALLAGVLALAAHQVERWNLQRSRDSFERDATAAAALLEARLREPQNALQALRGLFLASAEVTAEEFRAASGHWLRSPSVVLALGHVQRVPRAGLAGFEQLQRAPGRPPYRVFDRADAPAGLTAADADVLALRLVEPLAANRGALGLNALSVPAARAALLRTARNGAPAATEPFELTQVKLPGVVLYQALFGEPAPAPASSGPVPAPVSGMVFVTVALPPLLKALVAASPPYLQWCLLDAAGRAPLPGSAAGCDVAAPPRALVHRHVADLADRRWLLELRALPEQVPGAQGWDSWLFAGAGLLGAAALGALLLTVTGRARRIELAVDERTADLRRAAAERERTEAALRASEQRLRAIAEQLPIGIATIDIGGTIREANPKLRDMVGHTLAALGTYTLPELAHPDDRDALAQRLGALATGQLPVVRQRVRLERRDGSVFWAQASFSLLRAQGSQAPRVVGVFEDITEHLRLEDAEQAREVAESANQAKSEFLSRMSHELRTPLNAMLGFAQLLEMDNRPALAGHQGEWVAQIQQAGWHLLHMINDTLDLSRIETGAIRLDIAPVELVPLLRACTGLVEPEAARRGITLTLSLAPDATRVVGDATRIKQIVTNLLSNAVKYNVDGGRVLLATRRCPDQMVDVTVQDSGLGMTDTQLAALFQPFNRLGREQSAVEGTGIGLVIARRLTELMGGQLRVTSLAGHGSTFVFNLPAAPAVAAAPDQAPAPDAAEAAYHRRRVLYIEDNDTNAEVMRGILAQRPQVELVVCPSGLDALAAVRRQPPSLVLLDMHLPDIDGQELLRHLRDDPASRSVPVVVVSADATTTRIEQAFACGASDYVTKPVNVPPFLALLDRLLGEQVTQYG